MNIAGLDLSLTATGVALPDDTFVTVKANAKGMTRLGYIRDTLNGLLDHVDLVVLEGYAMNARNGAHQLGELGGVIRLHLHQSMIPYVEVAPSRLKKYATGKGNADKDTMLIAAAKRWPTVANNNEADAAWLRDMGLAHFSGNGIAKAKAEILAQIDWPVLTLSTPAASEPWGPSSNAPGGNNNGN